MEEDSGKVYAYDIFVNLAKLLGVILSVVKFLEMLTYVVQIKNLELLGEKLKFVDDKVNFVKYQVVLVDNEVKAKWSILDNKMEYNFPSFYEDSSYSYSSPFVTSMLY
ncbi:15083_t:CDS:2 [Funneliformis geosporum]|nr:15083_t:CDS:2 [Funneliformis geosporum]